MTVTLPCFYAYSFWLLPPPSELPASEEPPPESDGSKGSSLLAELLAELCDSLWDALLWDCDDSLPLLLLWSLSVLLLYYDVEEF